MRKGERGRRSACGKLYVHLRGTRACGGIGEGVIVENGAYVLTIGNREKSRTAATAISIRLIRQAISRDSRGENSQAPFSRTTSSLL